MMSQEDIQALMEKMHQDSDESGAVAELEDATIKPVRFAPLHVEANTTTIKASLMYMEDLMLDVYAELGQTVLKIKEILSLDVDSIIELKKPAGEAADVYINHQYFAKAEVMVINDAFAIRIKRIVRPVQTDLITQLKTAEEGQ